MAIRLLGIFRFLVALLICFGFYLFVRYPTREISLQAMLIVGLLVIPILLFYVVEGIQEITRRHFFGTKYLRWYAIFFEVTFIWFTAFIAENTSKVSVIIPLVFIIFLIADIYKAVKEFKS